MSQFTLTWNSSALTSNSNAVGQRAVYRYKLVGGSYISAGFSPTNDLAKTATTTDSPTLDDNKIIQFKIQTLCTAGGPTDNDNGIQEVINFAAITPVVTKTEDSSTIVVNVTGTDILKARFTLKRASDNTTVGTPNIVDKIGNSITDNTTGLIYSTNYYWQVEFYTTLNNIEVKSSDVNYTGAVYSPYSFTTDNPPVCNPVTSITVNSIEVA